ncbi:inorganic phosphate transporter [bacterium]|nr:MAG: inorganic phosphate transporter [bacterium]
MLYLILIAAFFLAYSNGANDNFKGVATLFGSGTTDYRKAIRWATLTTALGSVASLFVAEILIKNFSGKGLVPDAVVMTPEFAAAVALGGAGTVMLATLIGMPISTTHGLVGALAGCGVVAVGYQFNFGKLGDVFILPLIASPLLAAGLSYGTYILFRHVRKSTGIAKSSCACIGEENPEYVLQSSGQAAVINNPSRPMTVHINSTEFCKEQYVGSVIGVSVQSLLNSAHFVTAGIVCFARGLNDTPKMAGLLLLAGALSPNQNVLLITLAVVLGGWLNARKVAETMSKKITAMNDGQGFTANLVTSLLVTTASFHGLPVSTTHVSVGSLFGIGAATGESNLKVIRTILLSWILTLPVAAVISATVYWSLVHFL